MRHPMLTALSGIPVLFVLSAGILHADWKTVGANVNGIVSYDRDNLKAQDNGTILGWIRNTLLADQVEELTKSNEALKGVAYSHDLMSFNCKKQLYTALYRIYYASDGRVLSQNSLDATPTPLTNDEIMNTIASEVCPG